MADTLQNIRDGYKGTPVYAVSAVLADTSDVVVQAAPGAGYHYEIRRLRCVNKTAAESGTVEIHDDDDTILGYMQSLDPAVCGPDDTGWLNQPIIMASNKALEANLVAATSDCYIQAWLDKVAD